MKQRMIALLISLAAGGAFASNKNVQPANQPHAATHQTQIPFNTPYSALSNANGAETRETKYVVTGVIEKTEGDQVWIRSGGRSLEISSSGLTFHRGLFANDKVQAVVTGPSEHLQALQIMSPAQEAIAD
jgi:hypothetical protein